MHAGRNDIEAGAGAVAEHTSPVGAVSPHVELDHGLVDVHA
jgi:hypothetical protein